MQVIWKATPGCSLGLHSGAAPTALLRDPSVPPAMLQVTNRAGHEPFPLPAPVLRLFISSASTQQGKDTGKIKYSRKTYIEK